MKRRVISTVVPLASAALRPQGLIRQASVAELATEIAASFPSAVALRARGNRMSYGELNARANRLAEYLRSLDLGPEFLAGICLERSFDQVIAILAAWKAGGAVLPLDLAWPEQRMRTILLDAGCAVLIGQGAATDLLGGGLPVVALDRDAARIESFAADSAAAAIAPDQLAYVIYTSGTTGGPKGVEIAHGNLSNLVSWHCAAFGVTSADRSSHLAGLAFDAAIWEVWPYLAVGACVSLADDTVRTSPELLRTWLVEEEITIAFAPTALAGTMIAMDWPAQTALRYLLTGAETLHAYPRPGLPFALVNNYGPTECTVVATSATIPPSAGLLPPIGRPISNTQIHLLDEQGTPVPPGKVGEIYVGGASVGRGYRNDPDLTAARFIADGFGEEPGGRLYRTGDLGALLPDGQIQFRGRVDGQAKIRGHRVEPDEIAGVLNRHPSVQSCAVTAQVGRGGEKQLVAYLVLNPAAIETPNAEDVRGFVAAQLPEYMVPASFVRLDALPLNANGKLDKAALPEPDASNTLDRTPYRAPQTLIEQRLVEIFAEILDCEDVGADDNFFLAGGHSLLGTQVVVRSRAAFGVELTLLHLFEAQTIGGLATTIERLILEEIESMSEDEAQRLAAV
jgi:amino acid adenylation domain-containing protein